MMRRHLPWMALIVGLTQCVLGGGAIYFGLMNPDNSPVRAALVGLAMAIPILFLIAYIPARRKRLAEEAELLDLQRKYPRSVIDLLSARDRRDS